MENKNLTQFFQDRFEQIFEKDYGIGDLCDYFLELSNYNTTWKEYVEKIRCSERVKGLYGFKMTQEKLANYCGYRDEREFRRSKINVAPSNREDVMRMAVIFGLNKKETNSLLKMAGHGPFYPLHTEDAIYLFLLKHNVWQTMQFESVGEMYEAYEKILANILAKDMNYVESHDSDYVEAVLDSVEDFETCMAEIVTAKPYRYLLDTVEQWTKKRKSMQEWVQDAKQLSDKTYLAGCFPYLDQNNNSREDNKVIEKKRIKNLQKIPENIVKNGKIPKRYEIISMLLQYELTRESMDEVLEQAKFGPLYSRSFVESSIAFILTLLYDQFYEGFLEDADITMSGSSNLPEFEFVPQAVVSYMQAIIDEINKDEKYAELRDVVIPELNRFISEYM